MTVKVTSTRVSTIDGEFHEITCPEGLQIRLEEGFLIVMPMDVSQSGGMTFAPGQWCHMRHLRVEVRT